MCPVQLAYLCLQSKMIWLHEKLINTEYLQSQLEMIYGILSHDYSQLGSQADELLLFFFKISNTL